MTNLNAQFAPALEQFAPQYRQAVNTMMPVINELIRHYQHWFERNRDIIEPDDLPQAQLGKFIEHFPNYCPPTEPITNLKIALRGVIVNLDCFLYRTHAIGNNGKTVDTWQPLIEPYQQFQMRHESSGNTLKQSGRHGYPFPPVDMIIHWADSLLREHGSSVYDDN